MNLIDEAKQALEEKQRGTMAPDLDAERFLFYERLNMARALVLAGELADLADEMVYILRQHRVSAPCVSEAVKTLAAFRAAVERQT